MMRSVATSHYAERSGPVSQAQKMIWLGQQIDPTAAIFNTAWCFEFRQSIDPEAFSAAFERLVEGADVLRLVIRADASGEPRLIDLGRAAGRHENVAVEDAEAAAQWIDHSVRQPLDIASTSFHSALIRIGDTGWTLYFNQHHAVADATTGSLLLEALGQSYTSGAGVQLPRFLDFTEGAAARTDPSNAHYWDNLVQTAPPPKFFGTEVSGQNSVAVMCSVPLGTERMSRLNELIAADGFRSLTREMSIYHVILTVLAAWIHRATSEERFPVGIVTHGRSTPAARATPGCFIELFPMTIDCAPRSSFRDLHALATDRSLDLFRKASPGSSSARALTSFNAVLNVITAHFGSFAGKSPGIRWLDNGHIDPGHAFRLNVLECDEQSGLTCAFAFNTEVFDEKKRQRAIRQFFSLFDACLADPETAIDTVPLAAADEASTKLTKIGFEPTAVPDVIDAFDTHLAEDPDSAVIIEAGKTLSRRDLAARIDSFACALLDNGVAPGDRVGVYLPRSTELVAALMAILRVGATFVPLDPSQTAHRLDAILGEAKLRLTVADPSLATHWWPKGASLSPNDVPEDDAPLKAPASREHPAYVMFTSGTTGTPKGVVIGRRSISRYAAWANRVFADDRPATWPLFSAIGFDLTLTSIFAPLVTGGAIRVYPEVLGSPNTAVMDVFAEDQVDAVKLTPAHLRLVLAANPTPRKRIRSLILGGEDLPTDLARAAGRDLGEQIRIFNEYGPTEATVGCMIHEFDPARDTEASIPIGRPAEATAIYVLDKGLNPVPDNVPGDLYIAGADRLALGYLHRPKETAASFIDNPFADGVMYKSGDIASVGSDGTIRYHGRADTQIKIGGVRIETGEIRAAAQAIDGLDDCAVTLHDHAAASAKLCRVCGIPKAVPGQVFVEPDLCRTCKEFDSYKRAVDDYFGDADDFRKIIEQRAALRTGDYDCVMLLSGGKDSTYALSRLVEITDRVLVATLDNGFISEGAKENIRVITERLGVEHRYLSTPAMNEIFVDSLKRNANVCQGCFKTIYTLGLHLARDVGAPTIVTGLSRGQLFETRLAPELFANGQVSAEEIDRMVLEARRSYHLLPDVATERLNCGLFDDPEILDRIAFIDFYRYSDVSMTEMYRHLEQSVGWSRPMDTGRSTNCLINDVGIHVHRARRSFHNYAMPYSWDVRLGHKTRSEAVDELNDDIDAARVSSILDMIGFDEPVEGADPRPKSELVLYYVSAAGLSPSEVRTGLLRRLPREAVPGKIVAIPEIPLTPNGKTDIDALPTPEFWRAPFADVETRIDDSTLSDSARELLGIWRRVLGRPTLGIADNFYDAGGDSLTAIQIATQARAKGFGIGPQEIFRHQTVESVLAHLTAEMEQKTAAPRRQLSSRNSARLAALFGNKRDG